MTPTPSFSSATRWIWHPDLDGTERDQRVLFRKCVDVTGTAEAAIRITADSRYTLWINGIEVGSGPPRHWPTHRPVERHEIGGVLQDGENTIEVMVHAVGTSTSSYIPGRAGLLAEITTTGNGENRVSDEIGTAPGVVGTDKTWECRIASAYDSGPPRINVSQPFVERYDARRIDEAIWVAAAETGPAEASVAVGPMGSPQRTVGETPVVPEFVEMAAYPWRTTVKDDWHVANIARVESEPFVLSVDFREAFYPGDLTTEDRLQVGAIAIAIDSAQPQSASLFRKNRRWPYEPERLWVNGTLCTIQADQKSCSITLEAGTNLILCDVSGAYQRFWLDIVLLASDSLSLGSLAPLASAAVAAIGPFDSAAIGNIVCAEGFEVAIDHPDYLELQRCRSAADLTQFVSWSTPICEGDICTTNAKLLLEYRTRQTSGRVRWTGSAMSVSALDEIRLDFGDEVSGFLELDIELPAGTRVDAVCYEYHRPEGPELPDDLNNWFRYVSRGGRQTFRSMLRRGFRYLTLTFYPDANATASDAPDAGLNIMRIHAIRCHERLYPTPQIATFACSDRRLTEIFAMSRRTVALCMEDTYVDCPGFEQALWIGDTRNTALLSYVLFGAYGVARNSLLVAAHSLQRSKLPESHGPSGVPLVLTAWSLLWMIATREYVMNSGDTSIVEELRPWLYETAAGIHQTLNRDGLVEISAWNMLDWAPMDTPYHGIVTHQNMLAVWALREVATLLEENAGTQNGDVDQNKVEGMLADADRISTAVNAHLWDTHRLAYRDAIHADGTPSTVYSVQTHVIALLAGVVPEDRLERVTSLVDSPEEGMVVIGSPFMSFFHYRLLVDRGAYQSVLDEIREKWGEMIDEGSTTCWETFRGFYTERLTRSYCHAWSAAPAWYLPEVVLGITRTGAAWDRVQVSPHPPDGMGWARGSVVTPQGLVEVVWNRDSDGSLRVQTTLPPGVSLYGSSVSG